MNETEGWKARASCKYVDPDLFFPLRGEDNKVREAKAICNGCPVIEECLDYGLRLGYDSPGIWGGTTQRQRRTMKDRRREALKLGSINTNVFDI